MTNRIVRIVSKKRGRPGHDKSKCGKGERLYTIDPDCRQIGLYEAFVYTTDFNYPIM